MGHLPRWANLGASVAAHGRHSYGDVFHYHPAIAVVIGSFVLQHGREQGVDRPRHSVPGDVARPSPVR